MLSRLTRSTCLLILLSVLCLALSGVRAMALNDQSSIYLPIVQPRPVLVLSGPVTYATSQYSMSVIGEVTNLSTTQAFSVTLRAVVYFPNTGITETLTFSPAFSVILPRQSTPFFVASDFYGLAPIVRSLAFDQVIPTSTSTIRPLTVIPQGIECYVSAYGYITGLVRNDNTVPVAAISLAAWSLHGNSTGRGSARLAEPLLPGTERTFSTSYIPICSDSGPAPDVSIHSFQYAAQGKVVP